MSDTLLRKRLIRLAHERAELRASILGVLRSAASWSRGVFEWPTIGPIQAYFLGPWAVFKQPPTFRPRDWGLVFVKNGAPAGNIRYGFRTKGAAISFLTEMLDRAPELAAATGWNQVMAHSEMLKEMFREHGV